MNGGSVRVADARPPLVVLSCSDGSIRERRCAAEANRDRRLRAEGNWDINRRRAGQDFCNSPSQEIALSTEHTTVQP